MSAIIEAGRVVLLLLAYDASTNTAPGYIVSFHGIKSIYNNEKVQKAAIQPKKKTLTRFPMCLVIFMMAGKKGARLKGKKGT